MFRDKEHQGLERLEFDFSPASPSSKFDAKSEEALQATLEEINSIQASISKISVENMASKTRCKKMESDLEVITKALNKNVDAIQSIISRLEEENEKLIKMTSQRQESYEKMRELFQSSREAGIDLKRYRQLNYSVLNDYFGEYTPNLNQKRADAVVKQIASTNRYFNDVTSNQEFIEKCSKLIRQIQRLEAKPKEACAGPNKFFMVENYRNCSVEELRARKTHLEQKYAAKASRMAAREKELRQEMEMIQKSINNLKNGSDSSSSTPIRGLNLSSKRTSKFEFSTPTRPSSRQAPSSSSSSYFSPSSRYK